jgi:holo-[acyl-carrier protein] synthase
MIGGIGVDIAEIARFERFVREDNRPLLGRLFTRQELDYCSTKKHAAQHLALRFAAKEAFLKALGTGLRDGISWQEMEVVNDLLGKPALLVSGRAAEILAGRGLERIHLSLSHDAGCAIAMLVLEAS